MVHFVFGAWYLVTSSNRRAKMPQSWSNCIVTLRCWRKATGKFQAHHSNSQVHKFATLEYDHFQQFLKKQHQPVDQVINSAYAEAVEANRVKLKS